MSSAETIRNKTPNVWIALPVDENGQRGILLDPPPNHSWNFIATKFSDEEKSQSHFATRGEHIALVEGAVSTITDSALRKVVISRVKRVEREFEFDLRKMMDALAANHPNAFVYFFRNEDGEMWMGATPEVLLRKRGRHFETFSLAGTQKRIQGLQPKDYSWGEKEKDEQQFVTDYLKDELNKLSVRELTVSEPQTVIAGNAVHLKSSIRFESDLPAMAVANLIHPTPAVCGTPRDVAMNYIVDNEPHSRGYYTGIIGIEHGNGDADLFVNLRCMRIEADHFALYAGGGITRDSIPELEWEETELKMKTMLEVLKG